MWVNFHFMLNFADIFTHLFYLLIQLVWAANYGRWCWWWLQSQPPVWISVHCLVPTLCIWALGIIEIKS